MQRVRRIKNKKFCQSKTGLKYVLKKKKKNLKIMEVMFILYNLEEGGGRNGGIYINLFIYLF